jgi:hypothetical protein
MTVLQKKKKFSEVVSHNRLWVDKQKYYYFLIQYAILLQNDFL